MAKKTETITIRVAPEEKERIKSQAEAADITVSKYLYRILFSKASVNPKEYLERLKDYVADLPEAAEITTEDLLALFSNAVRGEE